MSYLQDLGFLAQGHSQGSKFNLRGLLGHFWHTVTVLVVCGIVLFIMFIYIQFMDSAKMKVIFGNLTKNELMIYYN